MSVVTLSEPKKHELTPIDIPLSEIYSDSTFNVRGEIRVPDIVELARNINTNGLLQAITVQPYNKIPGFKYRIVVGHRRYAAFKFLQRETIPAVIKEGLNEVQALTLNFVENVNRKDLNILEEAYGIKRFFEANLTLEQIAKLINKGKGWVQVRVLLLKMPEPIQQEAAAGFLTQPQIQELATIHDTDEQLKIVRQIKEAKLRGEKRMPQVKEKPRNPTIMKRRKPEEIFDMIEDILDNIQDDNPGHTNPFTRAMAWCNGEITDLDLFRDIIEYCKERGLKFTPPEDVRNLLV